MVDITKPPHSTNGVWTFGIVMSTIKAKGVEQNESGRNRKVYC